MKKITPCFLFTSFLFGCANTNNQSELRRELKICDIQVQSGDYGSALKHLDALHSKYPENKFVLDRLASVEYSLGKKELSSQIYEDVVKKYPGDYDALVGLSKIYIYTNTEYALNILEKLSKKYPDNSHLLNNYGVALDFSGQYALAQQQYRRAMVVDPTLSDAAVNLGLSLGLSGDMTSALNLLRPYIANGEGGQKMIDNYVMLLVGNGNINDASNILASEMPSSDVQDRINTIKNFWSKSQRNLRN